MTKPISGVVFLYKPQDVTSFQTLHPIKKEIGTKKVGHTGTLDKFASGLLIVLIGTMTKLNRFFSTLDKCYEATFFFGLETDTLDPEGTVIAEGDIPSEEAIKRAVRKFIGPISQSPPKYSAIHIAGKRAYQRAEEGENIEIPSRTVFIHDIRILEYTPPRLRVRIECSKGTYIRSLARDIALACNSRGYVETLCRICVGPYTLDEAVARDQFDPDKDIVGGIHCFQRLPNVTVLHINDGYAHRIKTGQSIFDSFFIIPPEKDGIYALFDSKNQFIAVIERNEKKYSYIFVGNDS